MPSHTTLGHLMSPSGPIDVCFVWQKVLPYHQARLDACRSLVRDHSLPIRIRALQVISEGGPYDFLPASGSEDVLTCFPNRNYAELAPSEICREVESRLNEITPDVVFCPATPFPEGMGSIRYRNSRAARVVVMDDAWERTDLRSNVVRWVKRLIHECVDGVFIPADSHSRYFESLGFSGRTIWPVDVIDNRMYEKASRDFCRQGLCTSKRFFLYVGRLTERKGISDLLAAYAIYRSAAKEPFDLVVIGGGPLEGAVKTRAGRIPSLHFVPFQSAEVLSGYYANAHFLVVPSRREPWALVVNEALACSCPVIATSAVGSASELIRAPNAGFVCEASVGSLASTLFRAHELTEDRRMEMGARGKEHLNNHFSLDSFARSVLSASSIGRRRDAGPISWWLAQTWPGRMVDVS